MPVKFHTHSVPGIAGCPTHSPTRVLLRLGAPTSLTSGAVVRPETDASIFRRRSAAGSEWTAP